MDAGSTPARAAQPEIDCMTIPAPNYTQIPNAVLDAMADMSDAELRIVVAIARQTFGWHKKRDKISLSHLRRLTGMSRQGVLNGLAAGVARGLIERTPDPGDPLGGIWYRLLVESPDDSLTSPPGRLVHQVDQSTPWTRTSPPGRPELVHQVDQQKKGKEKKESVCEEPAPTHPQIYPDAVTRYFAAFPDLQLTEHQIARIISVVGEGVEQLSAWEETIDDYQLNPHWKPENLSNMLSRFKKKRPGSPAGVAQAHLRPPLPVAPYQPPTDALPPAELAKRLKERHSQ